MASYVPTPRPGPVWESSQPPAEIRSPIQFPAVHSGSQRDYSGHHTGNPEFAMPTLGKFAGGVKHQLGNLLLYGALWEKEHQVQTEPASPASEPAPLAASASPAADSPVNLDRYAVTDAAGYAPYARQPQLSEGTPTGVPWTVASRNKQREFGMAGSGIPGPPKLPRDVDYVPLRKPIARPISSLL